MNEIPFETAAEARYTLEAACLPLACERRDKTHLTAMHEEIDLQRGDDLSDEEFCASDVRFHRTVVEATGNPVLSFQMVGVIDAMQPLMNMITYRMRVRTRMADLHGAIADAIAERDQARASASDVRDKHRDIPSFNPGRALQKLLLSELFSKSTNVCFLGVLPGIGGARPQIGEMCMRGKEAVNRLPLLSC